MSPAIGRGGERERRIELCVISAATLCHEMLQSVMNPESLTFWPPTMMTVDVLIWCLIVFITPVKS